MSLNFRKITLFSTMVILLLTVGFLQSWNVALLILNMCIISAIMALGVNLQWGYAGLFNAGIMGFIIVGGLATVIISMPPVQETWSIGGMGIIWGIMLVVCTTILSTLIWKKTKNLSRFKYLPTAITIAIGYLLVRLTAGPAIEAIEGFEAAKTGYLGGLGLPILISWIVGGLLAAGIAWVIGKITLDLKSDYLAIATLGISAIIL